MAILPDTPPGVSGTIDRNQSIDAQTQQVASYTAPQVPSAQPSATQAPSTLSPYYPRYTKGEQQAENFLDTFQKPESENSIIARKTAAAQGQINALNKHYDNLLGEQKVINEGRDRSTSSVNVMSGLSGSTEANVQQGKTTELNQRDNKKIQDERNLQIQTLLTGIRTSAVKEAQDSRAEARLSADAVLANRTKRQTEATSQLTNLAKAGVTAAGFKTTDPQSYGYLVKALGSEENVKAMFTLNRPQETILDKRIEGGKYIIAYQNPLDGKVRMETLDLGLPDNYTKTIDAGDRILAMPENWDGDPSKLITINKGLTPAQASSGGGSGGTGGGTQYVGANGKPLKLTAGQVDSLSGFDSTIQASSQAISLLDQGVQTGPIAGTTLQMQKFLGTQDSSQLRLESLIGKIKADFMKALSGAAVSEAEVKRLSAFLPSITDQESVIRSKLETLTAETGRAKANLLNTLGASGGSSAVSAREAATNAGYDYDAMKADGLSDEEILNSI